MKRYVISLILLLLPNGFRRAKMLRNKKIFKNIGQNVSYRPFILPSEPELITIGSNVWIAAGVRMVTHDMINQMLYLKGISEVPNETFYSGITIGDNVVIGADTIILPGKNIGNNVIIGAGSVVSKDIPDNTVWAGNPIKFISTFDDFVKKRKKRF